MTRDWAFFAILPAVALLGRDLMPPWLFMWSLAFAIFAACKWLTWRRACRRWTPAPGASAAYLFGWVGMDAENFFRREQPSQAPAFHEWLAAAMKTACGVAFIVAAGRLAISHDSLAAGWLGMVGLILFLHFGSFQLLALLWRFLKVDAQPLMRRPLHAASLAEFWGRRWNAAFNQLAYDIVFWPMARKVGARTAAVSVFLVSGLIHDAVISLPAGGGYGLPTAYFLLQAAASLFERSRPGRLLGLGRGWRGHAFTLVVTGAPAFWLFHPLFVRNVILPMLRDMAHLVGM